MKDHVTIGAALLWTAGYFGIMLLYTFLDVALWRKFAPGASGCLDLASAALCAAGFLLLLQRRTGFRPRWLENVTGWGLLLALACAAGFYLALDMGLDPLLARAFPDSERQYQEAVSSLLRFPVPGLVKACILAPIVEETLTRGFLLGGLREGYGAAGALLISSLVFALLHFNMVQTLSALVCALALGMLYLRTGSLLCCILAHCGYNTVSCIVLLAKGAAR